MDEVLIICAQPNQINYAKFNLYDYSLVAAITLCCYAYMVHYCHLILIGRHVCFMVNCKSHYALSYVQCLSAWLVQKLLYPTPTISAMLCGRYLHDVFLFGVVAYTLWLCGKCYCG